MAAASLLLLAGLAGGASLAWRLGQGPLDVTGLLARAAPHIGLPPGLSGTIALQWAGFAEGPLAPLRVEAHDLRFTWAGGQPAATLEQADATLPLAGVLAGSPVPERLQGRGLRLSFALGKDGSRGGPLSPDGTHAISPDLRQRLHGLREVELTDTRIAINDPRTATTGEILVPQLRLHQDAAGHLTGETDIRAALNGAAATARLRAEGADDGSTVTAELSVPSPAAVALALGAALPGLGVIEGISLPLEAKATFGLDAGYQPRSGVFALRATAGSVQVLPGQEKPRKSQPFPPPPVPSIVAVSSVALDATLGFVDGQPAQLRMDQLRVVLPAPSGAPPVTVVASGTADRGPDRVIAVSVAAAIDAVPFVDLPALWPLGTGGGARPWVTENVVGGRARDLQATARLTLDPAGAITLQDAHATLLGEDLSVYWLRPVPPIMHGRVAFELVNPDLIQIQVLDGRELGLRVLDGSVRIDGVSQADQMAEFRGHVAGPLADGVALLKHPRLKLLSQKKDLTLERVRGRLDTTVSVRLPLENSLTINQIAIHGAGQVQDGAIGGVVAGHDMDRAQLHFDVTNDRLLVDGAMRAAGIPVQDMHAMADFRDGPPEQAENTVRLRATVGTAQLAELGVKVDAYATGSAVVSAEAVQRRSGAAEITAQADMRQTALTLPGWSKRSGQPASASAAVRLQGRDLVAIDTLRAEGPGLLVAGRADLAGGRPQVLRLDRFELGRTRAAGEIRLPAAPGGLRVALQGPVLDLDTPVLKQMTGSGKEQPATNGARDSTSEPWAADVRFGQVMLPGGRALGPLLAQGDGDGTRIRRATLELGGAGGARGSIRPDATGRSLDLRAADVGRLVGAAVGDDTLTGGSLVLTGRFDDRARGGPLTAQATLTNFQVNEAVIPGKLLQALTLYGLVDALRGRGVVFSTAEMPFTFVDSVLRIKDARAYSSSLGMTATGSVDFRGRTMDMAATVVPAYALNSLPGRIPLLGRLFTAEKGGGLIAADVHVRGKLDDPSIMVNPLSVLTPGFLRRIFRIFD